MDAELHVQGEEGERDALFDESELEPRRLARRGPARDVEFLDAPKGDGPADVDEAHVAEDEPF